MKKESPKDLKLAVNEQNPKAKGFYEHCRGSGQSGTNTINSFLTMKNNYY